MTWLLVGLGNPGSKYAGTRHNVGFELLDALVAAGESVSLVARYAGLYGQLAYSGDSVHLLKPLTFMNASGRSVAQASIEVGVEPEHVVVVHDELDLPLGQVRLKLGGGEAGHRGLTSISSCLGTKDYLRLRIGIGRPDPKIFPTISEFVLGAFSVEELSTIQSSFIDAQAGLQVLFEQGLDPAMNQLNRRKQ